MFPKLAMMTHMIKQESTGKELKFRPYLVKEEKILMGAKESKQVKDIFMAIKTVLSACCLEKHFDVDSLPLFDLESLFLRLRAISVNNVETVIITDDEDKEQYLSQMDFNAVKVTFPEPRIDSIIKVGPSLAIQMKYPSAAIYDESNAEIMKKINSGEIFDLILECIDKIFDGDTLLKYNKEQLIEFLDSLDIPTYKKIKDFLLNMPRIEHRIDYKNSLGHDRFVIFKSIVDFFFFL
jgi:hypothetical protein